MSLKNYSRDGVTFFQLYISCPVCNNEGRNTPRSYWSHDVDGGDVYVGDDATYQCKQCGHTRHVSAWEYGCPKHSGCSDDYVYKKSTIASIASVISCAGQLVSDAGLPWLRTFMENLELGWGDFSGITIDERVQKETKCMAKEKVEHKVDENAGYVQPSKQLQSVSCPKCGTLITGKYCWYCGASAPTLSDAFGHKTREKNELTATEQNKAQCAKERQNKQVDIELIIDSVLNKNDKEWTFQSIDFNYTMKTKNAEGKRILFKVRTGDIEMNLTKDSLKRAFNETETAWAFDYDDYRIKENQISNYLSSVWSPKGSFSIRSLQLYNETSNGLYRGKLKVFFWDVKNWSQEVLPEDAITIYEIQYETKRWGFVKHKYELKVLSCNRIK